LGATDVPSESEDDSAQVKPTTLHYATSQTAREDAQRDPIEVAGGALSAFAILVATIVGVGTLLFCLAMLTLLVRSATGGSR
jgi:hypothetical protein